MARLAVSLILSLVCSTPILAELRPDQIAIIAKRGDRNSENVAKYYARERKVPVAQILTLPFPEGETMSRADWESKFRPAIRKWLRDKKLANQIKCFLTVWGVPLKIAKSTDDTEVLRYERFLQGEWRGRIDRMNLILAKIHATEPTDGQGPSPKLAYDAELVAIRDAFQESFVKAQERIAKVTDEQTKRQLQTQMQRYYVAVTGLSGVVRGLAQTMESTVTPDPNIQNQIGMTNGRLLGLQESRMTIELMPVTLERELRIGGLVERSEGIFGALNWLKQQIDQAARKENWASFDNELALVAISDYPTIRWHPNYLNAQYRFSSIGMVRPTFMVARIDAPSLRIARRIIDDAIATEKNGLSGKAYFDARGIYKPDVQVAPGSYADYDRSVIQCAELLKKHSTLEVVVDNTNDLFKPGQCPNAALYCGWYSLGNYVDAFDWEPGSVGYHIASSEATTLKKPESKVWCKSMLEDGIAATLGPVEEPYLTAFPRPEQFYLMLISGKYTLAECYWSTNPYTSWTMTLIGDPLYNPFKAKPALKTEGLPDELKEFLQMN